MCREVLFGLAGLQLDHLVFPRSVLKNRTESRSPARSENRTIFSDLPFLRREAALGSAARMEAATTKHAGIFVVGKIPPNCRIMVLSPHGRERFRGVFPSAELWRSLESLTADVVVKDKGVVLNIG